MYSKFLFVGLGGSGGKTLRFLKREIKHWMRSRDIDGRVPAAWQFLHIDTPVNPDGDEINHMVDRLEADEYLGLIAPGTELGDVQNVLDADGALHSEMRTWRVEPAAADVPVQQGAGQMRAIGQTVAMAYAKRIRDQLDHRVSRMKAGTSAAELGEMYANVTGRRPGSSSSSYVVVVSSLAGGTGAGLLNLVCDLLRALDTPAGDNVFAVLYTPEVFRSIGSAATAGVHPNSLAAVSELLNGYWWQASEDNAIGVASPRESDVLRRAGLPNPQARNGPKYPFLVGRVGAGGVDHGSPDRLFEMAARALASWVIPADEDAGFLAYTVGNWPTLAKDGRRQAGVLVDEGEPQEQGLPPMSALGFARLSVGTQHLKEYARQRIVKDVLRHVARYHIDSDEARSARQERETDDPDAIARFVAEHHKRAFLHTTCLAQAGPDDNQILADLRPDTHDVLVEEFESSARLLAGIDDEQQRSVGDWRRSITEGIRRAQQEFESAYRERLEASVQSWIAEVGRRIVEASAESVAERGLWVTAEILAQAETYLRYEAYEDLMSHDVPRWREWSTDIDYAVDDQLGASGGRIRSGDRRLEDAVSEGVNYGQYAGNALVAERAARLCSEVAGGIVSPLRSALLAAQRLAEAELSKTESWVEWSDEPPPASVRPPAGDFPLIDPDRYPQVFAKLVARDVGARRRELEQREELRRQIVTGRYGAAASGGEQACIGILREWWPSGETSAGGSHTPADLRVEVATGLDELSRRALGWLERPGSAWDKHLSLTIRGFVGSGDPHDPDAPDPAELLANQARLDAQLAAAIAAAAPFISLDGPLMGTVHDSTADESPTLMLSPIPLESHATEERVRSRLSEMGLPDDRISQILNNDASIAEVDITGLLAAPVSPLVVESLMRPISERWNAASTPALRRKFWEWRRAQPLDAFVPVPQALLRAMVRGWYTAQMLGRVDRTDGSFAIVCTHKKAVVSFPDPLLSTPRADGPRDHLAQVLEALPLAYVEVSRVGALDPLDAYIELRELGRSALGGDLFTYESVNPALSGWIEQRSDAVGISPQRRPLLDEHTSGHDCSTPTGRAAHVAEFCRETMGRYQREFEEHNAECGRYPELLTRCPLWTGLWERHMRPALHEIAEAALRLSRPGTDEGAMM